MKNYEIILQQLGGNKFAVMTGSKNFIGCEKQQYLRMDLSRNNAGVNRLEITLSADDTYKMHFFKGVLCKKTFNYKVSKEQKFDGVYADQLTTIFEQVTGLYTSL